MKEVSRRTKLLNEFIEINNYVSDDLLLNFGITSIFISNQDLIFELEMKMGSPF